MAQFQSRRAPNVSQYIANLNSVPDMQQSPAEFANFEDDIALFTQGDFYDFDLNAAGNERFAYPQHAAPSPNTSVYGQQPAYYHPGPMSVGYRSAPNSLPSSPPNGLPSSGPVQQSQPTVPSMQQFASLMSQGTPQMVAGQKRGPPSPEDYEDQSRNAAEEDKRRRNTAASARFRVKKKQREQALEKTAKEMTDRVSVLEARIGQLEMENAWLKGLITEKNVKPDASDHSVAKAKPTRSGSKVVVESEADEQPTVETSLPFKKRGVGTEEEAAKA